MLNLLDKTMWSYIIKDIGKELEYLPYAVLLGILMCFVMKVLLPGGNKKRHHFGKAVFFIYLFAVAHITLFEREPGTRTAVSLTLFETLGGSRNNAYVVENILLFIPFGFLMALLFRPMRSVLLNLLAGASGSLMIESIQLVTQRGYFQADDILMNSIGAVTGCICYWLAAGIYGICRYVIIKWSVSVKT